MTAGEVLPGVDGYARALDAAHRQALAGYLIGLAHRLRAADPGPAQDRVCPACGSCGSGRREDRIEAAAAHLEREAARITRPS